MKLWQNRIGWILAALPMLLLGGVLSLMLHVRLGFGRFPRPMVDDYIGFGFRIHDALVACAGVAAIFVGPGIWLVFVRPARPRTRAVLGQVVLYFFGWLLIWLLRHWDPGLFFKWYFD